MKEIENIYKEHYLLRETYQLIQQLNNDEDLKVFLSHFINESKKYKEELDNALLKNNSNELNQYLDVSRENEVNYTHNKKYIINKENENIRVETKIKYSNSFPNGIFQYSMDIKYAGGFTNYSFAYRYNKSKYKEEDFILTGSNDLFNMISFRKDSDDNVLYFNINTAQIIVKNNTIDKNKIECPKEILQQYQNFFDKKEFMNLLITGKVSKEKAELINLSLDNNELSPYIATNNKTVLDILNNKKENTLKIEI